MTTKPKTKPIGNPNISKAGANSRWSTIDGTKGKIGKHVFALKLPVVYEQRIMELSPTERLKLMRSAIMKAIDEVKNNDN